MSEMPDLGKIVSLIMENPELISKIQGLANGGGDNNTPTPPADVQAEVAKEASTPIEVQGSSFGAREKRNRLLGAMKPYLSSERAKAIDSMMSVADILDMMKTR